MKKIFIAVSSFFMVAVITMLVVLGTVRKNIVFEYDTPSVIRVYNKSTSPIKSEGLTEKNEEFGVIVKKLKEMTNLTLMQRLNHMKTLKANVNIDSIGTYNNWRSEMKKENIVIEIDFDDEQDLVVYDAGHTRVVSYWCLAYVITGYNNFDEISFIDNGMTGIEFENYCKKLLIANGFENVKVTQASNDYGTDLTATKNQIKYAIQCKKYTEKEKKYVQ